MRHPAPRRPLVLVGVALCLLAVPQLAQLALTASNAVPATNASRHPSAPSVNDLKPNQCNGITFTIAQRTITNGNFSGGRATDLVLGGPADQVISGGAGNDCLVGAGGNDTLQGNNGDDILIGGIGANNLQGGNNADTLYGGPGDDILDGGNHTDVCYGGGGSDTFISCETQLP